MLDIDRISLGWQVWLTPRQTRLISDALSHHRVRSEDTECLNKLIEWFKHESELHRQKLGI